MEEINLFLENKSMYDDIIRKSKEGKKRKTERKL